MRRRWCWLAALLALALAGSAAAVDVLAEEAEILGADTLKEGLTEEAGALLEAVSPVDGTDFAAALKEILRQTVGNIGQWLTRCVKNCVSLLAVALLAALVGANAEGTAQLAVQMAGCLGIAGICTSNLTGMTTLAEETMDALRDFSNLLLPVLSSAVAASGGVTSGGALYAGATLLIGILTGALRRILIPCVYCALLLATAQYAMGDDRLDGLRELLGWAVKTMLKVCVGAFTGYLTITGLLGGAADGLTRKAAESALSAAIPVVGSMLADAAQTILASAGVIRNAVGAFGLLAVLATGLGAFFQLAVEYVLLRLTAALGALVAQREHAKLLSCAARTMGELLAMVGSAMCMVLVSICAFLKVVQG